METNSRAPASLLPVNAPTLDAAWRARAAATPLSTALIHEERSWSYRQLFDYSRRCAEYCTASGLGRGNRIVLMLDNGPGFLAAFFGCQLAGLVPVPVSPKSSPARIAYLLADSGAAHILIETGMAAALLARHRQSDYGRCLAYLPGADDGDREPGTADEAGGCADPADCAVMQYTSGSTGDSKGVAVSHRALLANIEAFGAAMALRRDRDVFSSLLPLFHDMGLVCFGLMPLLAGLPLVLHRQEALSLYAWLEGIGRHRATITGAPDSLLHIANRVVERPADYPLDSLRMLICGSEPVRADTVETFGRRFAARAVLKPAYGMAELTLCATLTPHDEPLRIDARGRIASGRAIAGVGLRIRRDDGAPAERPGEIGEILVLSPAVMSGYWRRPAATAATFTAEGFLATGDIGCLDAAGYLYVLGRIKNLIVRAGEKFSPHDIETLAQAQPQVRRAAVVQNDDDAATVIAVLEVDRPRLGDTAALEALARDLCREAHRHIGLAPDTCWFVAGGTIPVTENGKVRHAALRQSLAQLTPAWRYPPPAVTEADHAVAFA
jgi:acyl-CoA synthetase (AMP-forming)/AMP-acid ligase II